MDVGSAPNRVHVFARVRPALPGQNIAVQTLEEARAVHVREDSITQEFVFDSVFSPTSGQDEVYSTMGHPVVQDCLNGFNGSILAYGQTGSGKTHSLLHQDGSFADSGLLPRVVAEIYDHIARDSTSAYEVEAAAVQVYNEQVDDLLHPHHKSGKGHNMAVQTSGDVTDLTWTPCVHADDLSRTFSRARTNLVYAETKMNKASSRSHAVFQIKITRHGRSDLTVSRLSIVDLAGSERVKKSGVDGLQFKEATAINKSLLAFGNVVSALVAKKRHIPYRDSKLTHILSPCIGNNCKTSLLVCSSPAEEHAGETLCSLEFASRAMQIEVHARMNRTVQDVGGVMIRCPVVVHQPEEDELTISKQIASEAVARAEEAEARAALAEEARMQALERANLAEARALAAEQDVIRFITTCDESASLKASGAEVDTRVHLAEQAAKDWRVKCEEALLRIESLEAKLAEASRDVQVRRTQLCATVAELEKLQAERVCSDKHKEEATEAGQAARLADARAAQVEAESDRKLARAKAEAAAARAEQARAEREAQQAVFKCNQACASLESDRARWSAAHEDEEYRLAKLQESLSDQQSDMSRRAGLLVGLEMEKQKVAVKAKQLEKDCQELQLAKRRVHNAMVRSGPPPLMPKESPSKNASLSTIHNHLVEQSPRPLRSRSSTEAQHLRKSPNGSTLIFSEGAQPSSCRSRTPSRTR